MTTADTYTCPNPTWCTVDHAGDRHGEHICESGDLVLCDARTGQPVVAEATRRPDLVDADLVIHRPSTSQASRDRGYCSPSASLNCSDCWPRIHESPTRATNFAGHEAQHGSPHPEEGSTMATSAAGATHHVRCATPNQARSKVTRAPSPGHRAPRSGCPSCRAELPCGHASAKLNDNA